MEETEFHRFLTQELRRLLSQLDGGLQPSNIALHEVVVRELRKQNPDAGGAGNSAERAEALADFERNGQDRW